MSLKLQGRRVVFLPASFFSPSFVPCSAVEDLGDDEPDPRCGGVQADHLSLLRRGYDFWHGAVRPLGDELHAGQAPRRDHLGHGAHAAAAQLPGQRRTAAERSAGGQEEEEEEGEVRAHG